MKKKKQTNPKRSNGGETGSNRNVSGGVSAKTTGGHARNTGETLHDPNAGETIHDPNTGETLHVPNTGETLHVPNAGETLQGRNPAAGKPYFEVLDSVRNNSCDQDGYTLTEAQKKLLEVQGVAIDLLLRAHNSMIELAAVRLECKLSNTRVSGVARELKELIKVMSVYDC